MSEPDPLFAVTRTDAAPYGRSACLWERIAEYITWMFVPTAISILRIF